jgi:hypothetical protein
MNKLLQQFIHSLFRRPSSKKSGRRVRLGLEELEQRQAPATLTIGSDGHAVLSADPGETSGFILSVNMFPGLYEFSDRNSITFTGPGAGSAFANCTYVSPQPLSLTAASVANVTAKASFITSITLATGTNSDQVTIVSTAAPTTVTSTGGTDNVYIIGPITAPVHVTATAGRSNLSVYGGNRTFQTVTISDTTLSGLFAADVTYDSSAINDFNVYGNGDDITVTNTPGLLTTITPTQGEIIRVEGVGNQLDLYPKEYDVFVVSPSAAGDISIVSNNGVGQAIDGNTLIYLGSGTNSSTGAFAGTVTQPGFSAIAYADIQTVTMLPSSDLVLSGTSFSVETPDVSNQTADFVRIKVDNNVVYDAPDSFLTSLTLNGSSSPNSFDITPLPSLPINVNGGSSPGNTLDVALGGSVGGTSTVPFLTSTSSGMDSSGSYTFNNEAPISFQGIQTLTSNQTALNITATSNRTTATPGQQITYTITVRNSGVTEFFPPPPPPPPGEVEPLIINLPYMIPGLGFAGATVSDIFPPSLSDVTYTSTASAGVTGNTASGSGNIDDVVTMPDNSSITYTVTGTIAPDATGTLTNTATVTPPAYVSLFQSNTTATVSNPLGPVGNIATVQPSFAWKGVTGVSSYEICLADRTTNQTVTPTVTGTVWTPSQPLSPGDNYVWWVGAVGADGKIAWNVGQTFTIAVTANNLSGTIATLLPTFTWTNITGVTSYEMCLADRTTSQTVTSTVTGTSWTPTQPLNPGDTYVWWVASISAYGKTAWDVGQTFTIAPTGSGPSGTIATLLPTFTWNSITGVTFYEIWLTDKTTNQTVTPTVTGTSWTSTQPLNLGDNYVWWVGAGANGKIAWDIGQTFTIAVTANSLSGTIATLLPTFTWNNITGVGTYQICLTDRTTNQTVSFTVTGTSWTPPQPLNLKDTYVWWVGAIGANGNIAWDTGQTFAIAPTASGPSGTIATLLPTFTWNNVTGVTSYETWLTDQTTGLTVTAMVTGTTWTPTQALHQSDSYIWWVGAVQGNTIAWDDALHFTITILA